MFGVYVASGSGESPVGGNVLSTYLQIKKSSMGKTKAEQVYRALRETIRHVGPGHRLPNASKFATLVEISSGTASRAYRRLADEGHLQVYKHWGALTQYIE